MVDILDNDIEEEGKLLAANWSCMEEMIRSGTINIPHIMFQFPKDVVGIIN